MPPDNDLEELARQLGVSKLPHDRRQPSELDLTHRLDSLQNGNLQGRLDKLKGKTNRPPPDEEALEERFKRLCGREATSAQTKATPNHFLSPPKKCDAQEAEDLLSELTADIGMDLKFSGPPQGTVQGDPFDAIMQQLADGKTPHSQPATTSTSQQPVTLPPGVNTAQLTTTTTPPPPTQPTPTSIQQVQQLHTKFAHIEDPVQRTMLEVLHAPPEEEEEEKPIKTKRDKTTTSKRREQYSSSSSSSSSSSNTDSSSYNSSDGDTNKTKKRSSKKTAKSKAKKKWW